MSYNCCFCSWTFNKCSAYSQHILVCIKKIKFDKESNSNDKPQDIDNISLKNDDLINYINDEVYNHKTKSLKVFLLIILFLDKIQKFS